MLKKAGIAIASLLLSTSAQGLDLGVSIGPVDASVGIGDDGVEVGAGVGDLQADAGIGPESVEDEAGGTDPASPEPGATDSAPADASASTEDESSTGGAGSSGGEAVSEVGATPTTPAAAETHRTQRRMARSVADDAAYDDVIDFTRVVFVPSNGMDDAGVAALREAIDRNPELLAFLARHGYAAADVIGIELLPDGTTKIFVSQLVGDEKSPTASVERSPHGAMPIGPSRSSSSVTTVVASAFCLPVDRVALEPGLDLGSPYAGALSLHDRTSNEMSAFARLFDGGDYDSLSESVVDSASLTRKALEEGWWWLPQRIEIAESCDPGIGLIAAR